MKTTASLILLSVLCSVGCQSSSRKNSVPPVDPTENNICINQSFLNLNESKPLAKAERTAQAWSSVTFCNPDDAKTVNFSYEVLSESCAGTVIQFVPESGQLVATLDTPQTESCEVKLAFESKGQTLEFVSVLRFVDRLAQEGLSISLVQSDSGVDVKVQTKSELPSTFINNATHPDYVKYLEFQKRLNGLGYAIKKSEANGSVNFSITSLPAATDRVVDTSKPFYAFLESLDRYAADVKPILAKGDNVFGPAEKFKQKALYGSTTRDSFSELFGEFIGGPFLYCGLPLFNDIKIPSFLQNIIDINCQSRYLQTFRADMPSLRISLADKTYKDLVDAGENRGENFRTFPFSTLARSVCPAAADLSTQQRYKEAGWINEVNVEDTELVTRQCGMFIHTKILPRLKNAIEQAVSRPDLQTNPTALAYIEAISRAASDQGRDVDVSKVNETLNGLFDAEISSLAEQYNKVYDLTPAALNKALSGRDWTRTNFAEAINQYFASLQNSAQTPFTRKYLESSESTKKKYRDYLATLLSIDCSVGPEVSANCVSISRRRLDRYSIRISTLDAKEQVYWSIGGVATGI